MAEFDPNITAVGSSGQALPGLTPEEKHAGKLSLAHAVTSVPPQKGETEKAAKILPQDPQNGNEIPLPVTAHEVEQLGSTEASKKAQETLLQHPSNSMIDHLNPPSATNKKNLDPKSVVSIEAAAGIKQKELEISKKELDELKIQQQQLKDDMEKLESEVENPDLSDEEADEIDDKIAGLEEKLTSLAKTVRVKEQEIQKQIELCQAQQETLKTDIQTDKEKSQTIAARKQEEQKKESDMVANVVNLTETVEAELSHVEITNESISEKDAIEVQEKLAKFRNAADAISDPIALGRIHQFIEICEELLDKNSSKQIYAKAQDGQKIELRDREGSRSLNNLFEASEKKLDIIVQDGEDVDVYAAPDSKVNVGDKFIDAEGKERKIRKVFKFEHSDYTFIKETLYAIHSLSMSRRSVGANNPDKAPADEAHLHEMHQQHDAEESAEKSGVHSHVREATKTRDADIISRARMNPLSLNIAESARAENTKRQKAAAKAKKEQHIKNDELRREYRNETIEEQALKFEQILYELNDPMAKGFRNKIGQITAVPIRETLKRVFNTIDMVIQIKQTLPPNSPEAKKLQALQTSCVDYVISVVKSEVDVILTPATGVNVISGVNSTQKQTIIDS